MLTLLNASRGVTPALVAAPAPRLDQVLRNAASSARPLRTFGGAQAVVVYLQGAGRLSHAQRTTPRLAVKA